METIFLQSVDHVYYRILKGITIMYTGIIFNKVLDKGNAVIFHYLCTLYDFTNIGILHKKFRAFATDPSLQNVTSLPQFLRYLIKIFTRMLQNVCSIRICGKMKM